MASSGLEMNIFKLIVYNNYYAKIWPLIITFLPINQDNYTTCASWNNIYMYYKSKLMGSSKFYNIQQLTDWQQIDYMICISWSLGHGRINKYELKKKSHQNIDM